MSSGNYYLDAQMSLLGSLMIDPEFSAAEIFEEVSEDDFSAREYKTIFLEAKRLFLTGNPIDAVILSGRLGDEYTKILFEIAEVTPTAANYKSYIAIVKTESRKRKLQQALGKISLEVDTAYDEGKIRQELSDVLGSLSEKGKIKPITVMQGYVDFLNRLDRKVEYLDWGFSKLNQKLYAERGDFIIIGARPSAGKTMLALNLAWKMSEKYKIGFFSLETGDIKIFDRMFASVFKADLGKIKTGKLSFEDKDRIVTGKKKVLDRQFEYVHASGMTVDDIRQATLRNQYEIIFVDYVGLVRGQGKDLRERTTNVSIGLHEMAQTMGVVVVALSQFSRPAKDQREREPKMEDLRESGQLEQDADVVMLLHKKNDKDPQSDRRLIMAKNKEGVTGYIDLRFDGDTQTFYEKSDTVELGGIPWKYVE